MMIRIIMISKKSLFTTLLSCAITSSACFAESTSSTDAEKPEGKAPVQTNINPFSDCGLGAAIFKNDAAAAISNIIWDLGTTAVTSGLSTPNTCTKHSTDVAQFILHTYPTVAEETAKGQGEHLTAMLNIAGCEATSHANIISGIRSDFSEVVASDEYAESAVLKKAEDYYYITAKNVSTHCTMS